MESKDTTSQIQLSQDDKLKEIETILRKNVKSKTLTDEAYAYMALLIVEDVPKNAKELVHLIGDFLTDGMTYDETESMKICTTVSKLF